MGGGGGRGGGRGEGEGERKDATREPVSVLMLHEVFLFSLLSTSRVS